jgi:hypothetical protein
MCFSFGDVSNKKKMFVKIKAMQLDDSVWGPA